MKFCLSTHSQGRHRVPIQHSDGSTRHRIALHHQEENGSWNIDQSTRTLL